MGIWAWNLNNPMERRNKKERAEGKTKWEEESNKWLWKEEGEMRRKSKGE